MAQHKCQKCGAMYYGKECPKCGTIYSKEDNAPKTVDGNPNLIICPDCGKPVSKKAKACPSCGSPMVQYDDKGKKKDSVLGIIAAICALFTFTSILGIILGAIDLAVNTKTHRHLGSWFAIIYGTIVTIFLVCEYLIK